MTTNLNLDDLSVAGYRCSGSQPNYRLERLRRLAHGSRNRSKLWHLGALLVGIISANPVKAECEDVLPVAQHTSPMRDISADDLIELRDIGQPDASVILPESPLAVSPDERSVAFIISRADLQTNGYCRALVVLDLSNGAVPRAVDIGGELITAVGLRRGLVERSGFPELIVPLWSPDGEWIAYLRRDKGVTRVWRARRSAAEALPVSPPDVDAESFAWSDDGMSIIYSTRPGYASQRAAMKREGKHGWHYDQRFVPNWAIEPKETGPVPPAYFAVELANGTTSSATAAEQVKVKNVEQRYSDRSSGALSDAGWRVGTELSGTSPLSPLRLWIAAPDGTRRPCEAVACSGSITGVWWSPDDKTIWFVRREGWAKGEIGLYHLARGSDTPERVLATQDLIQGCVPAGRKLLCLRENATTPRRLVSIDPKTGQSELIFNPNPEFASIRLGHVQRLKFKNALGLEAWGDLVLPQGYVHGTRLPMVIVQYHSDGFLRGGTGDDYPIHLFAARGYAVLSFERPAFAASLDSSIRSYEEAIAANSRDWADRRNILSALEEGVRETVRMGVADPKRIGITGLSDGATTTRFALINSDLFAAAAISTCCMDPNTVMIYGGIAWADALRSEGYPPATRSNPEFWKPFSMAENAEHMRVPLLMQVADSEALLALETFNALRDYNQPVEMYVFPNEYHYKLQPIHRRAVYLRAIDWFDFWLRGQVSTDAHRAVELERWEELKAQVNLQESRMPRVLGAFDIRGICRLLLKKSMSAVEKTVGPS